LKKFQRIDSLVFDAGMKKHREVIWQWYLNERKNDYPSENVILSIQWIAENDKIEDYGYKGNWKPHLEYCSDRMNGGRAKSILRLLKQSN